MAENGKRLWCWPPSWKGIAGVVISIAGFYGAAAAMGVEMPRMAWLHEVQLVAEGVQKNRVDILKGQRDDAQNQMWRNQREQRWYTKQRQPVPNALEREHDTIRQRYREKVRAIERLEK